jgi:hypothetical protein
MFMDKAAWDYKFFRDHFYPEKEPESTPTVKPCPFCGSKHYKIVNEKRVCDRCGKNFDR